MSEQEERNDRVFQLDPKKRPDITKRGGKDVLVDPIATLLEPCKHCGRQTKLDDLPSELVERLLAAVREEIKTDAASRTSPGASPCTCHWEGMVAFAKALIKDALGREVEGDYSAEIPAILLDNPLSLCYPPFAAQIAARLISADPTLWKVLKAFYRGATIRPYSITLPVPVRDPATGTIVRTVYGKAVFTRRTDRRIQGARVWDANQAGKSISKIARDEKLTERTVRELVLEARRWHGLRKRHRTKKKNFPR